MLLENSFEVGVPPEAAWNLLNDVPAVLPCMPGAELVEVVDEDRWKATLQVRLGPISLRFLADVSRETADPKGHRAVLAVDAREARGRGRARATITSSVEDASAGSRVLLLTELTLSGPLTQHGRVIVAPVAEQLTRQFAACIAQSLVPSTEDAVPNSTPTDAAVAKPIGGIRLFLAAIWRSLTRRRST